MAAGLLVPAASRAQSTGSIVGRVSDAATDAALTGADVRIDRLRRRTTTSQDGRFVLGALPPGEHDLRIEHIGYKPLVLSRVQVRAGRATELRITLETSPVEVAPLVVRADRERLIEPDLSTTHETVVGRELRELPVDRIEDVVELTTGVAGGHFRGGRIGQEVYVVDGIELKNQFEASREGFGLELSPTSLEEVDVITGGFGAQYGSALSGVVSYTTRRGNPDRWESRAALTTDQWAPGDLFRGFTGLSLSAGGPLGFLGNGATLFADVLLQGTLDSDPHARGLACLRPDDATSDLAAAIRTLQSSGAGSALLCPYSNAIIPHQRGDKAIAFARFDRPLGSKLSMNASLLRNRTQQELYTSEFKYNPAYQLGQRFLGTLANLNLDWLDEKPTGSTNVTVRAALMRLDRYLGVVDPATWDGFDIAGFAPRSFEFIGEDFARRDIIEQIALGSAIPGYITPGSLGASPFGAAGAGLFATTGTPSVASWSRSDLLSGDIAAARFLPSGSAFRAGVSGKLYRVETYERALAHIAGSMPNYARFFPATVATYGEADIQTNDEIHLQFGLRLEAFRSGIDFLEDRADFLSPVIKTDWKLGVMPRFGVAMPIPGTHGRSSMRLSYSRVAQPPDFRYFLDSTIGDSLRTDIRRQGNPDLSFEHGTAYEFGVSHLLNEHVSIGITAFRKTLENIVTGNLQIGDPGQAGRFSTGDFGSVNGVEVTVRGRWNGVALRAGWALQKARGLTAGAENDTLTVDERAGRTENPLAFDRRHSGDLSLFFGRAGGSDAPWSASITTNVQSGYPLMRVVTDAQIGSHLEVMRYLPWTTTTNVRASWDVARSLLCDRCAWRVVADARNIFGRENVLGLRSESGTVGPTLAQVQNLANTVPIPTASIPRESPGYSPLVDTNSDGLVTPQEVTTARFAAALDRYDPTLFYGEPRQLRLGIEVAF